MLIMMLMNVRIQNNGSYAQTDSVLADSDTCTGDDMQYDGLGMDSMSSKIAWLQLVISSRNDRSTF
jgi:hypothetical protein